MSVKPIAGRQGFIRTGGFTAGGDYVARNDTFDAVGATPVFAHIYSVAVCTVVGVANPVARDVAALGGDGRALADGKVISIFNVNPGAFGIAAMTLRRKLRAVARGGYLGVIAYNHIAQDIYRVAVRLSIATLSRRRRLGVGSGRVERPVDGQLRNLVFVGAFNRELANEEAIAAARNGVGIAPLCRASGGFHPAVNDGLIRRRLYPTAGNDEGRRVLGVGLSRSAGGLHRGARGYTEIVMGEYANRIRACNYCISRAYFRAAALSGDVGVPLSGESALIIYPRAVHIPGVLGEDIAALGYERAFHGHAALGVEAVALGHIGFLNVDIPADAGYGRAGFDGEVALGVDAIAEVILFVAARAGHLLMDGPAFLALHDDIRAVAGKRAGARDGKAGGGGVIWQAKVSRLQRRIALIGVIAAQDVLSLENNLNIRVTGLYVKYIPFRRNIVQRENNGAAVIALAYVHIGRRSIGGAGSCVCFNLSGLAYGPVLGLRIAAGLTWIGAGGKQPHHIIIAHMHVHIRRPDSVKCPRFYWRGHRHCAYEQHAERERHDVKAQLFHIRAPLKVYRSGDSRSGKGVPLWPYAIIISQPERLRVVVYVPDLTVYPET